ncbi:MAG: hypothetical protein M1490_04120 [Candidatus Bathyarchaeota archaeon]|nr:hypothetical protein [Candidatus Bathyarchaeota archaeon]
MELKFHGPFHIINGQEENLLLSPLGELKGVYVWAIPFQNKYLSYYVGETGKSFVYRTMEHIKCYLNGFYRIYNPEEFAMGKKKLVWGGMWKTDRKSPKIMIEYLNNYQQLSILAYAFLTQFRVFLAPLDNDNQRLRQRIEAAIAQDLLQQDGIIGSFQDNGIRYYLRRQSEPPIKIKLNGYEQLLGLNGELTI